MAKKNPDAPLKKGDRVVVTESLPGVPEGTAGKLRIVNGLGPWMRAMVEFDNGVWVGSVGLVKLTREADWPDFQRRRAAAAEAKANGAQAEAAKPEAASVAAPEAAASGAAGASKVPAHLLERAQKARERKAAAAAASGGE